MKEIKLSNDSPVSQAVMDMIDECGTNKSRLSTAIGMSKQMVGFRILNNTFSAQELIKVADALGFEVVLKQVRAKEKLGNGVGWTSKHLVKGIYYDTQKSVALCHTEKTNGAFVELYRDQSGRYFAVHYSEWDGRQDFICSVAEDEAHAMYEANATDESEPFKIE